MGGFENFLNKRVVVTKTDRYVKYGILKEFSDTTLTLIFDDGSEYVIPMTAVAGVRLDARGDTS